MPRPPSGSVATYIFGGRAAPATPIADIVKFTPSTGTVTTLATQLPSARYNIGGVAVGSVVYLFGGWGGDDFTDILAFDTVAQTLSQVAAMPTGRQAPNVFYDGSLVWVASGDISGDNAVLTFDPTTHAVTPTSLSLPLGLFDAAPLWDGTHCRTCSVASSALRSAIASIG